MTSEVVDFNTSAADGHPMRTEKLPHVLISPAMGVPAKFYRPLVAAFGEHGWASTVIARRGIEPGDLAPSRAHDWSYADEAGDLADAIRDLRREDPDRPVLVVGHSLGAQLCALLDVLPGASDARPDGYATVAGSVPRYRYYPGERARMLLLASSVPVVTAARGHWPAGAFGGPTPRTLMRQWARMMRTGELPATDGLEQGRVGGARPVLAVRLEGDALVTPAAAERLERCFPPGSLTGWTYRKSQCPPEGSTDHVRWARTPGPVVERIVEWWSAPA